MEYLFKHAAFFGDGIDQTNILLVLVLFDIICGMCWRIKVGRPLHSKRFFSGIIFNFFPSLIPFTLHYMKILHHSSVVIYSYTSLVFFSLMGAFLLQSILANLNLMGLKLPVWIMNFIDNEISFKLTGKEHSSNEQNYQ